MQTYFEKLKLELLAVNDNLTPDEALWWVEMLWTDFEATYAKAGYPYRGTEYAYDYVSKQIKQHGASLHLVERKPR
ncbi:hypothetical protein PWEIH_14601 [Listeria weihenstephanensis FSL R9-0317]|uniref:WVELL protein n=1 Tax=Listeria weihenstephanensis TaxID=1006155 RepID=A0A1S7FVK1_9LIST|nr:YfhJ family protein [Listeria weihenstephanensis]AQY51433.1 hypothetical protein UE46_10545 [Listeria weihenstephanensis]EUJ35782.1 hypothetical protein PWEIH_14601 [Listeria weihenstephanensis FSL R9-0317]MBC1501294.1 hypothetical protein [Listeria weihenstephanensis]